MSPHDTMRDRLVAQGLLQEVNGKFEITDAGHEYVRALTKRINEHVARQNKFDAKLKWA